MACSLRVLASAVALLALVASGCSSTGTNGGGAQSFTCGQKSPCPSDPASTQADTDMCNQALAGPCGMQARALFTCRATNAKCTASGTTDDQATNDACLAQLDAFTQCSAAGDAGAD